MEFFFSISQKKFVERHRKLMTDFMEDRGKEEEEANEKHNKELEELRVTLTQEYETKLKYYEVTVLVIHVLIYDLHYPLSFTLTSLELSEYLLLVYYI